MGEYSSVWPEICRVLSQIQWRFLRGISRKNYFGRIFQKFCANQGYPLPNWWNFAILSEILFRVCIALKIFRQVLSYVFCTKVRRHVPKQITRRRYGGQKSGHFVFGKPVLFTLGLGLTTPYSLGILVWNSYQTCVTVSAEFLGQIWAPASSHRIGNKFFIHHCRGRKEGSLVYETISFFSWVNTHPFDLKFVAFCPKFSGHSYVEFQEKTISGEFFRNFVQTKAILYQTREISTYFLKYYSGSVLRWKNSDKYFHMLFAPR